MTTPPIHLRRRLARLAVLALPVAIAACGSGATTASNHSPSAAASGGHSTATTIEAAAHTGGPALRVGDQAGTGAQALLQAAGLLHSFKFPITFNDFTSGPPILQAMSGGSLDIGNTGNAPPVFAAAGGARIKIVGALSNANSDVGLLVPKDSKITSVSQLKGRKIAVAQGSSADYHLLYVLKQAGLTAHDVQLVYLQPAQGLAAFESGAVDAWDVWPPFIEQARLQKGARVLTAGQHFTGNYSYEVASTAALSDPAKAREIHQYLSVLNRAHRWANRHSAAWARTWAAATGLPLTVMQQAAADTTQTPVPVNATISSAEQGLVSLFSQAGLIPKAYSFAPFTTAAFNASVK
jgi:sulfonate transport system substrate-binding protein